MEVVDITCTSNGNTLKADVLTRSTRSMRVAIQGTNLTLNLSRVDQNALYSGHASGLEFTSKG
jgi:hypothetical protein